MDAPMRVKLIFRDSKSPVINRYTMGLFVKISVNINKYMNTINKKTRKKRSKIWLLPETEFIALVKNVIRLRDVLLFFGLENKGRNFSIVKQRITELKLDTSHFLDRHASSTFHRKMTLDRLRKDVLVENSTFSRYSLKLYLIKFNLIPFRCECGLESTWNGKPLSLQLDHINGVSNDNRIENLRFICPNCHSQTENYAGKSNKAH
jgi:5-methylcytosine-specific restriction endonuclease McrA